MSYCTTNHWITYLWPIKFLMKYFCTILHYFCLCHSFAHYIMRCLCHVFLMLLFLILKNYIITVFMTHYTMIYLRASSQRQLSFFWWAALDALSPHKSLAMQHNWDESRMHIQHQHRIVETWVCMSGWCEDDFTSRWSHNKTTSRFVMSLRFEFPSTGACRSVVLQPLTSVVYKRCYHRTHTQRSPLTASNGNIFRPPCVHSGDMFRWADVFLIVTLSLSW